MPRFSLRTLIVVMLVGGPVLAGLAIATSDTVAAAVAVTCIAGIFWLGWTENVWWLQRPTTFDILVRVTAYGILLMIVFAALSWMTRALAS